MSASVAIRRATAADIDALMAWRMTVLREVFSLSPDDALAALAEANRRYYLEQLPSGGHLACFAVEERGAPPNTIVGCGGECLYSEMPSPDNPDGRCAYLMDIYVTPERRGRGIGKKIVAWLVNEAKRRGIAKIYLETSDIGRRLYEGLGFAPMPGMMKLRVEGRSWDDEAF